MVVKTPLEGWIREKIGNEFLSLEDYQCQKINHTLDWVRQKNIFYQNKLKDYPSSITALSELQQFPFMDAEEIRQYGAQMVCGSLGTIQRVVTLDTSGTSSSPKRCYFTRADQDLTIDFFGVGMSCLVSPADRVLILLPGERPGSVGDLLQLGLKKQGVTAFKFGPVKEIKACLSFIQTHRITSLVGAPSQILALQRWGETCKYPKPKTIRSILLTTDHVPQAVVRCVEEAWFCRVFNHYGMTEMGLGGGVDCEAHSGLHLREADMFFEIIDPVTGENKPPGEVGEIVFTTLTRRGMPLIRYRTGDAGRFLPDPCPCGTRLKTLDWVRYRWKDTIQWPSGTLSLADFDEILFSLPEVLDFKVVVNQAKKTSIQLEVFSRVEGLRAVKIRDAVESLPILCKAINSGMVELTINTRFGLPDHFGSLAKRKIIFRTAEI